MDFIEFTADKDDEGRRTDRIVRRLMPDHPLSAIYKYLRKGLVRRNKGKARPDTRVQAGDTISIAAFLLQDAPTPDTPPGREATMQDGEPVLQDLFANAHIRIISKPYGVPVQGGGHGPVSLDKIIVREYLRRLQEDGRTPSLSFRPGPLHRLDRRTTGVLAFSQSLPGAQWFSQALQDHRIGKEYLAIVEGSLTRERRWQDAILRTARRGGRDFHRGAVSQYGRAAETTVVPLGWGAYQGRDITLLRIAIATGRTHQIRLHCSHHGFPLLGDTAYGGGAVRIPARSAGGLPQDLFLHAWRLSVPQDNPLELPETIQAPLPENFRNMLASCLPEVDPKGYII